MPFSMVVLQLGHTAEVRMVSLAVGGSALRLWVTPTKVMAKTSSVFFIACIFCVYRVTDSVPTYL